MLQQSLQIHLPEWISDVVIQCQRKRGFKHLQARMQLAIELAHQNVQHGTGGPFGAAVFDDDNQLVSIGINLVETQNCSLLHAELVAMALAQTAVGHYDLSCNGTRSYELVSSADPCAMCLGAIPWSGITTLACGARREDACSIGFDEGDIPPDWPALLQKRGIEVTRDVLRTEANAVLESYANHNGTIYHPGAK